MSQEGKIKVLLKGAFDKNYPLLFLYKGFRIRTVPIKLD